MHIYYLNILHVTVTYKKKNCFRILQHFHMICYTFNMLSNYTVLMYLVDQDFILRLIRLILYIFKNLKYSSGGVEVRCLNYNLRTVVQFLGNVL
jgi:hypothetical protein